MHCTNCGEQLANSVKFCGSCGNEIAQSSTNTASRVDAPPADIAPTENAPAENESFNSVSKGEMLSYTAAALLAVAFIAWYQIGDFWKEPNWGLVAATVFLVSWIAFATIGFVKKKSAVISLGGGLIGGCLSLIAVGMFIPEQNPNTNAPTTTQQSGTTATVARSALEFVDGRVEWYTNTMNAALGGKNRQLWIRGNLRNISSDTLTSVNCVATLNLHFANGRKSQARSNNLCSDTPPSTLDSSWTINASSSAQIENRKTGGRELWQGPEVGEEFLGYEISTIVMELHVTASTPFGDEISTTVFSGEIPPPTHRAEVTLAQN